MKIKFHPLFIIYIFLCLYFGWFNDIFYYVITVVIHEYAHYFVSKKLGYSTDGMLFTIYGAGLTTSNIYTKKDDIKISLAGPFSNVILIILIVCFWWLLPSTYYYTYDFFVSNLVVLIFNMIPIYPLDGGRVIIALLSNKLKRKKIMKINNLLCFLIGLQFLIFFFISMFYVLNLNLLFVGLFFAINSILSDNSIYFEKIKAYNKSYEKPCEVKIFKVDNLDRREMLKYIKPNYYSVFLTNKDNSIKLFKEDDIIDQIKTHSN